MDTQLFPIASADVKTWWLYLLMGGTVVLTLAAFVFVHYLVRSSLEATFEVGGGRLVIHGGFYGRSIPIGDLRLDEAALCPLGDGCAVTVGFKRNGTSIPGLKSGWFTLKTPRGKEKSLLFLTDAAKAVLVPTRLGYSLLLSPDEPQRFMEALRRGG